MRDRTISGRAVLRIVALCRRRGHDGEALCREAGVSLAALGEAEARVSYEVVRLIGERALALTGDDDFGLHLAEDVGQPGHFDAGVLLLMASPTIGFALARMVANQRYWGDGDRAALLRRPEALVLRFRLPGATGSYARHADECAMAELALGVRALSGQDLRARAVRFRHQAPRRRDEHRRIFGCPITFDAAHTELELDHATCDTPLPNANATFFAIFAEQVERAIARLPRAAAASETVRAAVRTTMGSDRCTIAGTARALGVSARTLQRRLQLEGTSFAGLADAVRHEMALAYLDRGVSVAQVAGLLGFGDSPAFHRAFRRWTGSTPARHTNRAAG